MATDNNKVAPNWLRILRWVLSLGVILCIATSTIIVTTIPNLVSAVLNNPEGGAVILLEMEGYWITSFIVFPILVIALIITHSKIRKIYKYGNKPLTKTSSPSAPNAPTANPRPIYMEDNYVTDDKWELPEDIRRKTL